MNRCVTLCLMTILLSTINAFAQAPRKTRPSRQQPKISRSSDFGKFIGMWEYTPDSLQKKYFTVKEEQPGRFKFVEGFEYNGKITWAGTMVNHADGIYLRPLNGKLTGRFISPNFRATHGHDITYRITLSLEPNGNLLYSVSSELEPERYHATKVNSVKDVGEVAVSQARVATSVTETITIVPTGENAPESIIRVVSMTTIAVGKHRVIVVGGPCRSQGRARFAYIIDTKETVAKGDLFFVVPVGEPFSGWALRRANSREAAQYESCEWR